MARASRSSVPLARLLAAAGRPDGGATRAFAKLVRGDDAQIDLAHACLMIAQDAYPALEVDRYLGDIERMAMRLRGRMRRLPPWRSASPAEPVPLRGPRLPRQYRRVLRPRNSYLNDVIDRKVGIPISLSILYMVVGRRVRAAARGGIVPGPLPRAAAHARGRADPRPVRRRRAAVEGDLRERLQRVIPAGVTDDVPVSELPLDQFLDAASNRQTLARVLRNLKAIYRETDKPERMLEVLNRMLLVAPDATAELRERGNRLSAAGVLSAALKDLSDYVEREPEAADMDEVRVRLMEVSPAAPGSIDLDRRSNFFNRGKHETQIIPEESGCGRDARRGCAPAHRAIATGDPVADGHQLAEEP